MRSILIAIKRVRTTPAHGANVRSDRSMIAWRVIAFDCALIVGAWLAFLVILATLQWLGYEVGFDVWPMGEDRLGVWAIQQPSAGSAASLTWQQLDDRNPLSPWWYILFRKLILDLDCGLLLLRYAVGLVLALISYALVVSLGGLRSRSFALGLGIVVALFMANHYAEQVYWDREIALICSLASIICYARFVESGRQDYPRYALSLVLWFLAFTTYTVQCGAALAVAYLAFTRPAGAWRLSSGLRAAFVDTLPYGLLFVLYLLIWRTVALRPETYVLHLDLGKLLLSLRYGLLHYDVQEWIRLLLSGSFNLGYIGVACAAGLLVVCAMLSVRSEHNEIATPRTLVDVICVAALIALPTVAVEATGSAWPPGTRWLMIYHFTIPLAYLAIVASIAILISKPLKPLVWAGSVGALAGLALLFSLGTNDLGIRITRNERALRDGIASYAADNFRAGLTPPFHFIVLMSPDFFWYSSDVLSDLYARTWFKRDDISFRIVRPKGEIDVPASQLITLAPREARNAKLWNIPMGYDHVYFLKVDGTGLRRLQTVQQSDLKDYQIVWDREHPIGPP